MIGQRLAVRAEYENSPQPVEILMGAVAEERNPYSGAMMYRREDVRRPELMHEWGTFRATETEVAPSAYVLTENVPQVMANLTAHGVRYERIEAPRTIQAETFRIDSTSVAAREF